MKYRVILVVGASSGIGAAIASHLSTCGYIVYGTSRKPFSGDTPFIPLILDVNDKNSIDNAICFILKAHHAIDVLINCAGWGIGGPIELSEEKDIRQIMETNFFGVDRLVRAVLPVMREKRRGLILNTSSIGGLMGLPCQGFYSASKFALEGYSEALYLELKPFDIDVVLLEPGDFNTSFNGNRHWTPKLNEKSPYWGKSQLVKSKIDNDENFGRHPHILAVKVEKILKTKNPRFRYVIAIPVQKLSVYVKRILPSHWYLWILGKYYGVR